MKVYTAPLFFGKPLQEVLLLSDFEKDKKRYFDEESFKKWAFNRKGNMVCPYKTITEAWFVECFGVEK